EDSDDVTVFLVQLELELSFVVVQIIGAHDTPSLLRPRASGSFSGGGCWDRSRRCPAGASPSRIRRSIRNHSAEGPPPVRSSPRRVGLTPRCAPPRSWARSRPLLSQCAPAAVRARCSHRISPGSRG